MGTKEIIASPKSVVNDRGSILLNDAPIVRMLFATTKFAWLWLIIRIYVGYQWFDAGWNKLSGGKWASGEGLKGFWTAAVTPSANGSSPIAIDWYRNFIQFMLDNEWYTWFAPLIMWGEILVGIALILGALTGLAALFGGFMNWNYIMAGSASTNAWLGILAVFLVLAWKVSGWYGLDRWLLSVFGTPWQRGTLLQGIGKANVADREPVTEAST